MAGDAACQYVPWKISGQHDLKQPIGSKIVGIHTFKSVEIAVFFNHTQFVGAGA
jgi:hypothetical protein